MEGFYVAYLAGRGGNTLLLFAVHSSILVGVDAGGMKYDGTVEKGPHGTFLLRIKYTISPGTSLITGVGGVAVPTPVSLDFSIPSNFEAGSIVTIQTPFGPINAKLEKLRDFTFSGN